jgi:hypothetical protein
MNHFAARCAGEFPFVSRFISGGLDGMNEESSAANAEPKQTQ